MKGGRPPDADVHPLPPTRGFLKKGTPPGFEPRKLRPENPKPLTQPTGPPRRARNGFRRKPVRKQGGNPHPNDGFGHMSAVRCRRWMTRQCNPDISWALYPNTKDVNHADTKSAPNTRANRQPRNLRILGPKHRCRSPRRNFLKSAGNKL